MNRALFLYAFTKPQTNMTELLEIKKNHWIKATEVLYAEGHTLHVAAGVPLKASSSALAWLQDAHRCLHLAALQAAEAGYQAALSAYEAACQQVRAQRQQVDALQVLLQEAQALGDAESYQQLYRQLRSQGSRAAYPSPPQPAAPALHKPYCCVEGYTLGTGYLWVQQQAQKILIQYPGQERALSLPKSEALWAWMRQDTDRRSLPEAEPTPVEPAEQPEKAKAALRMRVLQALKG